MKKRYGFVSNSSSSSFVAVGFSVKDGLERDDVFKSLGIEEEAKNAYLKAIQGWVESGADAVLARYQTPKGMNEWLDRYLFEVLTEDFDLSVLNGDEDGVGEGDMVVCDIIADISDDSYEVDSFSFSTVEDSVKEMKVLRDKIAPKNDIKIYSGMRMC